MTGNKLLTFELAPDAETLHIFCNREGRAELVGMLKSMAEPNDESHPDHSHWMARSIGGRHLTNEKQEAKNHLYVMVTAHYVPDNRHSKLNAGADGTLAFETTRKHGELLIFGDANGFRKLSTILGQLELNQPRTETWRISSHGKALLAGQTQGIGTSLIKAMILHYRP